MSVYTTISLADANQILASYSLGNAEAIFPINHGTVNSNFYLNISDQRFILTVYETLPEDHVKEILQLTEFLSHQKINCPQPIRTRDGQLLSKMANKDIAVIECLPGNSIEEVSVEHCQQIGQWLAEFHQASQNYSLDVENTMGAAWRETAIKQISSFLGPSEKKLLEQVQQQILTLPDNLPQGIIHADLFRDNVLFENKKLTGVIDFYFACPGTLTYDLSILINDWCRHLGQLDQAKYDAVLEAYHAVRPLTHHELEFLPQMLLLAGLRFWLSRLVSFHKPRQGLAVQIKDPKEFKNVLETQLDSL